MVMNPVICTNEMTEQPDGSMLCELCGWRMTILKPEPHRKKEVEPTIPRATVADALAALRAKVPSVQLGLLAEFDATITALDLTADVFDAAIASRPDVLEKLADEAVKEKQ